MNRKSVSMIGSVFCLAMAVAGCGQPKMDMSEMKPAARPAELDKLDGLVGNWDYTFEMTMAGMDKPMKGSGTSRVEWTCDKWVLVEHVEGKMEGAPNTFHGMGIYTYDPHGKVFRTAWMDNEGAMQHATLTMDDAAKVWHTKGGGMNTLTGEKSSGKGMMKWIDANTMEFSGAESDSWGFTKKMEMKGVSKRK